MDDQGGNSTSVLIAPQICSSRAQPGTKVAALAPSTQGVTVLADGDRARMLHASARMANTALRVLALAERPLRQWPLAAHDAANPEVIEQELTFLGLIGLQDPPRLEVFDAVQRCKRAGMCTVMITGDHPDTARAIARELGILTPDDAVVIGSDLDGMSEQELAQRVPSLSVYARVTAEPNCASCGPGRRGAPW